MRHGIPAETSAGDLDFRYRKRDAITDQHPKNRHNRHAHEALHEDAKDVLSTDQTAVEEGQPRSHQEHKRGASEHPSLIAGVERRNSGSWSFAHHVRTQDGFRHYGGRVLCSLRNGRWDGLLRVDQTTADQLER